MAAKDPRLEDESRTAEIRRRIEETVQDAPVLARIALEAIVKKHNPDLMGTADSAGRIGLRSGKVSELTLFANFVPGGADRLRRVLKLTKGNMEGAQLVSTLHDMRFVFLDNDTRLLFATAYDGDWDAYINDFGTKIPELMNLLFQNIEGWPGIDSPTVKDFIAAHQVTAEGWFVANPQATVVDVRKMQRMKYALDVFLDTMSAAKDTDPATRAALKTLNEALSAPDAGDY